MSREQDVVMQFRSLKRFEALSTFFSAYPTLPFPVRANSQVKNAAKHIMHVELIEGLPEEYRTNQSLYRR